MSEGHCKYPFPIDWSSSLSDLTLAFLYDCYILLTLLFDILKIIICFISHVMVFLFTTISATVSIIVYYTSWIFVFFMRGILGLESKPTGALCWLLAIVFFVCYCDHQHHNLLASLPRVAVLHQQHGLLRRLHNVSFFRHVSSRHPVPQREHSPAVLRENRRNEEAEVEPINRRLEAQNVLNENEANFLVEADHRRILNDNRHNVALENGADIQRARIENRQNVERECHNTQTSLENHRNCTQERHHYFLRHRRSLPALNNTQLLVTGGTNQLYPERLDI